MNSDLMAYILVLGMFCAVWFLSSAALGYERWAEERVFKPEWGLGVVVAWFVMFVVFMI